MDICDLKALKSEYEREVIFAQAKVSVVDDIIARQEAKDYVQSLASESAENVTEETDTDTIPNEMIF